MKRLIEIKTTHQNVLRIFYELGNTCNYKCWYCFPGANEGTYPFPDPELTKHNLTFLIDQYLKSGTIDKVQIHFVGGEPTLWRHLDEVIRYVKSNTKCNIELVTNGSRTIRWWEENCNLFENVSISIHHESVDVDHILKVAEVLYKNDVLFDANIMFDHTAWDKCMGIYEQLMNSELQWSIIVKPINIQGETFYNNEQREFLKEHLKRMPSEEKMNRYMTVDRRTYYAHYDDGSVVETKNGSYFIMNEHNHYKGWECTVGQNWLYINRVGTVSGSCQVLLYGKEFLNNIYDDTFTETFELNLGTVVCQLDTCTCTAETNLTKRML